MNNSESKNTGAITTTLAPWLSVRNIIKAVEFYKAAFNAVEVYKMDEPDGILQVARLSIDGAEFWLSEVSADADNAIHETVGGGSVRMILTVTNPDALFEQALNAGATEVFPVGEDYGWRLGRLVDPFGLHWEIGKPLE